ncbi:hypothetical protein DFJ74DRAFT_704555 [Hyaloraphidium curvatum]|nr:hypothetical protein DFJ74DRAFT_704555 [Hyaloraphidium curvatum]
MPLAANISSGLGAVALANGCILAFSPRTYIKMQEGGANTAEDRAQLEKFDSPAGRTLGCLFVGLSYYYLRAGYVNDTQFQRASVVGRAIFDTLLLLNVFQGNLPKSTASAAVIELLVTAWQYWALKRDGNWSF